MAPTDKTQTLQQAIATHVRDGLSTPMGCALEPLIPFAASHGIIRQKRKKFSLIAPTSDVQFGQPMGLLSGWKNIFCA